MLSAVVAAVVLVYAWQLPLCVAVVAEFSGSVRIGIGVGTFGMRGARQRAQRHLHRPRQSAAPWLEKTGRFDEWLRGAKYLYAHRLLLRIRIEGQLGGTDAARLALHCGTAQALLDTLCALTDGRISGSLRPDFTSPHTHGTLRLTYAVRSGTAVKAALLAVGERISERVKPWKSIPLKA